MLSYISVRIILKWILNIRDVRMWPESVALIVLLPPGFLYAEDLKEVSSRVCPAVKHQEVGFCILAAPLCTVHFIHIDRFLGIVRVLMMRKETAD